MNYPLISEYEREIKTKGSTILNLPQRYEFVPIKTTPITIYKYGSGAFAGVFKVANLGKHYALRVFLNGGTNEENINRTIEISQSLSKLSADFLCEYQFYQQGITIKGNSFPAIIMEWIDGKPLNNYVDSILNQNTKISELQAHLAKLSEALEKVKMAHGDIQSGNVLVVEKAGSIQLKLVDYDAMFIPELSGKRAVETGHSSFQHPKRDKSVYNAEMDRFSFWLILTALEAIKFDKKLWSKDISVGFNDGDNFLFRASDLQNPNTSPLIKKLRAINQPSLNFYLDKLLSDNSKPSRDKVALYDSDNDINFAYKTRKKISKKEATEQDPSIEVKKKIEEIKEKEKNISSKTNEFRIESEPSNAEVYCDGSLIGATPINLNITQYTNKKIDIRYNNLAKSFYLNPKEKEYKVRLSIQSRPTTPQPRPIGIGVPEPPKKDNNTAIILLIGAILLFMIIILSLNNNDYSSYDYDTVEEVVETVEEDVVERAVEAVTETEEPNYYDY